MTKTIAVNYQIYGESTICGINFKGCFDKRDGQFAFAAMAENMVLSDIVHRVTGGGSLPAIIPDIQVDKLWLKVKGDLAVLSLSASVNEQLPVEGNDNFNFKIKKILFHCEFDWNKKKLKELRIRTQGAINIPDILSIPRYDFNVDYSDGNWHMDAQLANCNIMGCKLDLKAVYNGSKEQSVFSCAIIKSTKLISIKDVFDLSAKSLAFELKREKNGGSKELTVGISSDIKLKIEGAPEINGSLYFSKTEVCYRSDTPVTIPLFENKHMDVKARMTLDSLRVAWGKEKELSSDFDLVIVKEGLPDWLKDTTPDKLTVQFKITNKECSVEGINKGKAIDFSLPDFELEEQGHKVKVSLSQLGKASFKLASLGFTLGKGIALKTSLEIGLPDKINNMFGVSGGKPKHVIFNTDEPCQLDLGLTYKEGQLGGSLQMPVPPIKPEWIKIIHKGGEINWHLKLGKGGALGELSMPAPIFEIGTKGFSAKGELRVIKPLKIPLTPLKQLLKNTFNFKDVNDHIPDNWPIKSPSLLDEKNRINTNYLLKFFKDSGHPLSYKLKAVLDQINDALKQGVQKLPEMLLPYLHGQFDDGFKDFAMAFELNITPDAGISFDLASRVKGKKPGDYQPIRLLWPTPMGLSGVYFKQFSLGTMLGGSLIKVGMDCTFDTFDLPELLIGLLAPTNMPIPLSRNFHNRLEIKDLFMIIIYETVIPIPIPIFYDKIKWDYLNIGGFDLGMDVSFPNPLKNINFIALLHLLQEMREFIKDPKKRFVPTKGQAELLPTLTVGPVFAQLPEYISKNAYLGTKKDPSYQLHTIDVLAKVLNTLKFLSSEQIVNAVPVKYRKGDYVIGSSTNSSPELKFAGLLLKNTGVKWLLTTPNDFVNKEEYKFIALKSASDAKTLLQVLPQKPKPEDKGMILFLKASIDITYLAACQFTFGFVSIDRKSVATGFTLHGSFLSIYSVDLKAQIGIEKHQFAADGKAVIKFSGLSMLKSKTHINIKNGFDFKADLNLLQIGSHTIFHGEVDTFIKRDSFKYQGSVKYDLGIFPATKGYLEITDNSGSIKTKMLGLTFKWMIIFSLNEVSFDSKNDVTSFKLAVLPNKKQISGTMTVNLKAIQMESKLGLPMPNNNFSLYILGFENPLIKGSIKVNDEVFDISAKLDFKVLSCKLSGHFKPSKNEFQLSGQTGFKIVVLRAKLMEARLKISVGSEGIGVSGSLHIVVTFKTAGAIAYSSQKGAIALYLTYYNNWTKRRNYLRIVSLTELPYWEEKKPKDWPSFASEYSKNRV